MVDVPCAEAAARPAVRPEGRPARPALVLAAALSLAAAPAAAQGSGSQHLDRAYAQFKARHLDSAEVLLRPVLDSTVRATPRELGAAWLLRGVLDFYGRQGDSGAMRDFRRALGFAPGLLGDWLAQLDSGMGALWQRERGHALCGTAPREAPQLSGPGDDIPVVEQNPKILSGPMLQYPERARSTGITGRVLMVGIVDTAGQVERGSIKLLTSPDESLSRYAAFYFEGAKFEPGRIGGRAVRSCVQLPVEWRLK